MEKESFTQKQKSCTTNTKLMQVNELTLGMPELSCSQFLHQIMGQQRNIWDEDDTEIPNLMLDLPISSFTGLLTAGDTFEVQKEQFLR